MRRVVRQDRDVAVARAIGLAVGRRQPVVAGGAQRRFERRAAELLGHQERDRALEHRRLDAAALAGLRTPRQRRRHRDGEVQATDLVAEDRRQVARLAAFVGVECRDARSRLDDVVVRRLAGVRSALVVPGREGVDQAGPQGRETVVVEAEACGRLGTHVMHDDVGTAHEPVEHLAGRGLLQVERNRALVAIEAEVARAHGARAARPHGAEQVALRRLDLDHVRAEVAQRARRVGPEHDGREIDDPGPAQQRQHVSIPVCAQRWPIDPQV